MRLRLFIVSVTALAVWLGLVATGHANDEEVGCYTADVTWRADGYPTLSITSKTDPRVEWARVAHSAWIRYDADDTPNSHTNTLSVEIPRGAEEITVCTTLVSEGEVIPTGEGSAYRPPVPDSRYTVSSSVAPHPQILDTWITGRGLVMR